jgi:hypothetical protein
VKEHPQKSGLTALTLINGAQAQSRAGNAIPVTPENFIRAETDRYFGKIRRIDHTTIYSTYRLTCALNCGRNSELVEVGRGY